MFSLIRKFFHDERGVAAPFVALSLMSLIAASGAAIDYARAQMVQTKLTDTLDAAGLAAGGSINSTNYSDVVQNYFDVNFPQGYMDATISPINIAQSADETQISLSASASVPTIFMGIIGFDSMTVVAGSEVKRDSGGMEVVLVMDNTGSMAGQKLADLKSAATELVNILFGSDETKDHLWVGLVPFAQAVNVGNSHTSWLDSTYYNSLNWGPTSWMGCVDARTSGGDQTDDPPSVQKFKAYYWADNSNYNDWIRSNGRYNSGIGVNLGPNKYCSQTVMPMTNQKSAVLAGINAMQARGNTHINLGAVWGWRMLSPRWRGLWGGTMDANNLPLDYGTDNMEKVVILLTDGENTMSNSVHSAYGYLSEGKLGSTNATSAEHALDTRLANVCNSIKGHGIIVYSILFDTNSTNVMNLLRSCASKPDYFFDSPTGAQLHTAFRQIGDSLSNLRLSK